MKLALLGLAVVLLGAGCVVPAAPGPTGIVAASPHDPVLRWATKDMVLEQGVTLGGARFPQHAWVDSGASGPLVLEVAPHAGCLVVELVQLEGQGNVLLHAVPPSAADRTPLLVDGRTLYAEQDAAGNARIVIHDPQAGKWGFDVHADGIVLGFRGALHVTVLEEALDGYTAVPR